VLPNNTGKIDDDLLFHDEYVKKRSREYQGIGDRLSVAVLVPVFPRPKTDWKIYTHALDRDSLATEKKEYRRLDRQLLAMIDHARSSLEHQGAKVDKRVLIMGFSASGMFANRFTFLHPNRVKAAVIGSPGGWAIAPISEFKQKPLRYPVGVADLKTVVGRKLDLAAVRRVPMFIYLGGEDDNDSVIFGDGYETEDKDLIFELFGKTPVERWEVSKKLYSDAGLRATFRLYPGIKHTVSAEIRKDIFTFLRENGLSEEPSVIR
jgi:pimeloyl-ACP methyl ester carboxylesterase